MERRRRRSQVLAFSTARNLATSSPCSSGFTFSNTFETLPEGSMTNVVRRIPMYLRPNRLFRPTAVLDGDRVIHVGDQRVRKIVFLLELLM